jgi:acetyltransferase-like isoleucine patch superfamily enzyme
MLNSSLNLIRSVLLLPSKLINLLSLKLNNVVYERNVIKGLLVIKNQGHLSIGVSTKINSSKYRNIIGGDTRTSIIVNKGATLSIGKEVKISNSAFQCTNSITIGDYVMIGGSCKIWDTDFHSLDPEVRRSTPNEGARTAPIVIKDNVFIGGFSIILKGVTIGENSIIAAGSVVSKDIPANEVWGGNPAKFIRTL